jgi:SAM-dependent methyltransferase
MREQSSTSPVATSGALDLDEGWQQVVTDDRNRWTDPGGDEDFWASNAGSYERKFIGNPAGMSRLLDLVEPTDTVLEIGPGTGRYTLPLARRAGEVTALEASPSMAAELELNLTTANCGANVEIVEGEWPAVEVDEHDWVVAGWSLYRQPDLRTCLDRIVEVTRQGFVIIDSPGCLPPHRRIAVREGDVLASPPPRPAYYCGLLADRGRYPSVEIHPKTRERRADSKAALLETVFGGILEEPLAHADALNPWLHEEPDAAGGRWCYRYELPAAVISYVEGSPTQPPASVTAESQDVMAGVSR